MFSNLGDTDRDIVISANAIKEYSKMQQSLNKEKMEQSYLWLVQEFFDVPKLIKMEKMKYF